LPLVRLAARLSSTPAIDRLTKEEAMTDTLNKGRRDFLTVASVGGAVATLGVLGISEAMAACLAAGRSEKPL
jgi:hypothetical protein